jgi:asparagine synthase (glutamine-hydrolysing)
MTDVMLHRGPNDRGIYSEPGVAIGARRLSIIDVDGGHQPFGSEDGRVWAAQNGEIYNHALLRHELSRSGHRFRSRCDTEVLPHLYEEYGSAFAERLRGKFGLVVWDSRERRAVLVRDRLGVKPLYWSQAEDLVVFASELKSLLASGLVMPELDLEAIDAYLALGFIPGPRTPFAGIQKLMPGHRLIVDPHGVRSEQYWVHPRPSPDRSRGVVEHSERLLEALEEAVDLRLMSDVPLGAMLSGGLDSSLIVALMARASSGSVKTFSVGFVEDGETNELADARHVAEIFGCEHHELQLSFTGDSVDLSELAWHMDEPIADLSALGFHALCQLAAGHVTVALSGQGADELFGGYQKHRAAALLGGWGRLPGPARALARSLAPHAPARVDRSARTLVADDPAARLLAMSGSIQGPLRDKLVRGGLQALPGDSAYRAVASVVDGEDWGPLPTTLFLDAQLGLVDDMLQYFDRTSMAYSLEVRVPFLDHHLVELAATVPPELKVHRLRTKHVLKVAAMQLLPERIIEKRKIGFFKNAVGEWLRAQLDGSIADYLLDPSPRFAEMIDRTAVVDMVARYRAGQTIYSRPLIILLMLEIWLRTYLDRIHPVSPAQSIVVPVL